MVAAFIHLGRAYKRLISLTGKETPEKGISPFDGGRQRQDRSSPERIET